MNARSDMHRCRLTWE